MKHTSRCVRAILALAVALTLLVAAGAPALAVGQSSTLAFSGATYYVNCSGLNLRSSPNMGTNIIGRLPRGTRVEYKSASNGWWYVSSSYGTGYVDKQYLAPVPQSSSGKYYVTASALNVRYQPRTSASIRGTLYKGQAVTISQLNGDWGQLSTGGWVALRYLSKSAVSSSSSSTYIADKSYHTVRVSTSLNVRSLASTSSTIKGSLYNGASVYVVSTSGNWAYIRYNSSSYGWVSKAYLR